MSSTAPSSAESENMQVERAVLQKKKINFFVKACPKKSKLSGNDVYIYLRLLPKYGAKRPSQKKVMGVQSR
jgi:hypothetical protein